MFDALKSIEGIDKPIWLRVGESDTNWTLINLEPVTIIFGKNGSGKSNLLKAIAQKRTVEFDDDGTRRKAKYLKTSPERGGVSKADGNMITSLSNDENFLQNVNFDNESRQFRNVVASNFRELFVNLGMKDPDSVGQKVEKCVQYLEDLLPKKYYVERGERDLAIKSRKDDSVVPFENLSSGEKEMFSLGLDCLAKILWSDDFDYKVLLIDEPDVHVHPDLQKNFLEFIYKITSEYPVQVIIATHSLTFLAGSKNEDTAIIFLREGVTEVRAYSRPEISQELSLFLSNSLMTQLLIDNKIVLVEGPDDDQIWNQAIRSSNGVISSYFHVCGSKDEMLRYERAANDILDSLTDGSTVIVSLRDRDTRTVQNFNDPTLPKIHRYLTSCQEVENLILSDEVLTKYSKNRNDIYTGDPIADDIKSEVSTLWNSIKVDDTKTWQFVVGEQIGQAIYIHSTRGTDLSTLPDTSIIKMLGVEFVTSLLS